jgi:hypothetical protein
MTTTASATRSAPVTAIHRLEVPGGGQVDVTVRERDRVQPFLVLHGGAGPASVARVLCPAGRPQACPGDHADSPRI